VTIVKGNKKLKVVYYRASPAIWDYTVLHATQHPALTPAERPMLNLPSPVGWKIELTWCWLYIYTVSGKK